MKAVYIDHENWFAVMKDEQTGDLYLDAECGGGGIFTRRLKLLPDEQDLFAADPKQLGDLALRLCKWPERFAERSTVL